ncbi:unnamed protein product [Calypogeia fissa]
MGHEEPIILVVGTETDTKTRVADALAEGRSASEIEISEEGVRFFRSSTRVADTLAQGKSRAPETSVSEEGVQIPRRKSTSPPSVIDTVALATYEGWNIVDTSRAWIARNGLKNLLGKRIFVLCVATASGPHDDIYKEPDLVNNKFSWLNLLATIFKENQRAIMILVKLQGTNDSGATTLGMRRVLQRNGFETSHIFFTTSRKGDLNAPIKIALDQSAARVRRHRDEESADIRRCSSFMVPFSLKGVTQESSSADRLGPWGPERVIILGRTGCGKSTLAQMLTLGNLDPSSEQFASSSGIRGKTKDVSHGEGRGWYVVDTPGFGEPEDEENTISTEEAEEKIKRYVQLISGTYTHFIHVVMKDRIDWMEERLWQFFLQLFGEDIKENFTVVISNADDEWVENNRATLQRSFNGCESFLSAEFPKTREGDDEWEAELQEVRTASLKGIEDGLTILFRSQTYSDFGQFSKLNIKRERLGRDMASRDTRSWRKKASISLRAAATERYADFKRLALMLTRDDKPILDLKL